MHVKNLLHKWIMLKIILSTFWLWKPSLTHMVYPKVNWIKVRALFTVFVSFSKNKLDCLRKKLCVYIYLLVSIQHSPSSNKVFYFDFEKQNNAPHTLLFSHEILCNFKKKKTGNPTFLCLSERKFVTISYSHS